MLLQVGKLRQEAVSPLGQSAKAKAAVGPRDSSLRDPNLGPGTCTLAEPLAWLSMGTASSSPRDLQHLGDGRAACLPRKSHIRKVCDVFLTVYNAI